VRIFNVRFMQRTLMSNANPSKRISEQKGPDIDCPALATAR